MSKGRSETKPQQKGGIATQPAALKQNVRSKGLYIGIPKEQTQLDNRVALTPEAVALLVSRGNDIQIESGAGLPSRFPDNEYSDAGARIAYSTEEVFASDIVLKVFPPSIEEIKMMKPGKTLISVLNPVNLRSEYLDALEERKITAIAFEFIEDKVGGKPVVRAMSEIAGSSALQIASELLISTNKGKGILVGGITGVPPTKVVILGSGTVAEFAARHAIGLGAEVKIFDNHIYKLRRLKHNVGAQLYTSTIDVTTMGNAIEEADVVIGALQPEKGVTPCVVSEEMVANMKPGSVIIDVSIDQGGCFETSELTTHAKPVTKKYDILHYGVANIAARVPRTATLALSHIFTPILSRMSDLGGVDDMIYDCAWFMKGVYMYRGTLAIEHIAQKFNKRHRDLKLVMTARN